MVKTINTSELLVGMYIDDFGVNWKDHPFFRSSLLVEDEKTIHRIASAGIRQVRINTLKGRDVPAARPTEPLPPPPDPGRRATPDKTSGVVEIDRARSLYRETTNVVRNLMSAARSGHVDIDQLYSPAERMVQSAFRNPNALSGISRIKTKDEYTFMHCVGVSALLISFGMELDLPEQHLLELAVGGLIHDIGKTLVPQDILNKPGSLSEEEFDKMKDHVSYSRDLLLGHDDIPQIALDVALLHHERMDGQGYPVGAEGEQISQIGRMSAIVDVYDALTSVRVYKEAWEPTLAMKKLFEWSPEKFDRELVQRFIRCIGIYPVSTVVALESGRVGIVIDQTDDLTRPILRVVYNRKHGRFESPRDINLLQLGDDRIVEVINPETIGIDQNNFL